MESHHQCKNQHGVVKLRRVLGKRNPVKHRVKLRNVRECETALGQSLLFLVLLMDANLDLLRLSKYHESSNSV